jgi:hypothetical protein
MNEPEKPSEDIEKDAIEKKLAIVRAAAALNLGREVDIDQMLAEIEQGYLSGEWPRE